MDFTLTQEQSLLRDSIARMLGRDYGFARRTATVAAGGFDPEAWATLAELGMLGAHFTEDQGGFGGTVESMVVMEQVGRALVVEPVTDCAIVPGTVLAASATHHAMVSDIVAGTERPALAVLESSMASPYDLAAITAEAQPDGTGWRLTGTKSLVPAGAVATAFLVVARVGGASGTAVFLVPPSAPGVTVTPLRTADGATTATVALNDVRLDPGALVLPPDAAEAALIAALDRGCAAVCAEAVGAMALLLESTTAYTRERHQYDAPLASFQALQHRMAEMFVALETARTMSFLATSAIAPGTPTNTAFLAAARVRVGQSAKLIGEQAVQLHGGMGMSEDLHIAHYFKRLWAIRQAFGPERTHLRRFAAASAQSAPHPIEGNP